MAEDCTNCWLRDTDAYEDLSREELRFMKRFKVGELVVDAGTPIILEGTRSPQLYTVLRGMGLRTKLLGNGNRQVVNFVFPGDFVGLQSAIMGDMGHAVEASTEMTLCVFDRTQIWTLFKSHPERAYDLTWLAASEEHFLGEALTSVGQRTALQATAWALVKIFERGKTIGMVKNGVMDLPYRQQDLADALGLSLVHTNKTLARLRDRELAEWREGRLRIGNLDALADVAEMERVEPKKRPML